MYIFSGEYSLNVTARTSSSMESLFKFRSGSVVQINDCFRESVNIKIVRFPMQYLNYNLGSFFISSPIASVSKGNNLSMSMPLIFIRLYIYAVYFSSEING